MNSKIVFKSLTICYIILGMFSIATNVNNIFIYYISVASFLFSISALIEKILMVLKKRGYKNAIIYKIFRFIAETIYLLSFCSILVYPILTISLNLPINEKLNQAFSFFSMSSLFACYWFDNEEKSN